MFSPNEAEPMVWPSAEAAHSLFNDFSALSEYVKMKKETTVESYMKEKTLKSHENLKKTQKKNLEYTIDQLMVQLSSDRKLDDLCLNEIYSLISFSKDAIMHLRKMLNFVQHPSLCDPPVHPFEANFEEFKTFTNDVFVIRDGHEEERGRKTDEAEKINNNGNLKENQSYYLMDQWFFPSFKPPNHQTQQQTVMELTSYNEIPYPGCYLPYRGSYHPYQGSSSSGNPTLEMEPICPPLLTFHDLAGSIIQPLQHHQNINNIPIMVNNGNPNVEMEQICPPMLNFHGLAGLLNHFSITTTSTMFPILASIENPNLEMEPICPPVLTFHGLTGSDTQSFQHHHINNIPIVASNGNPNLEIESICPPMILFNGLAGSVTQTFQHHHNINNIPRMTMSQTRQYPFDFMSHEERSNNNNGGFQYYRNKTNDDLRQNNHNENSHH